MANIVKLYRISGSTVDGLTRHAERNINESLKQLPKDAQCLPVQSYMWFDGTDYHLIVTITIFVPDEAPPETGDAIRRLGFPTGGQTPTG